MISGVRISVRFRVTLRTARAGSSERHPIEEVIPHQLIARRGLSTREIAFAIDSSTRAARIRVASMVGHRRVCEVGANPPDSERRLFTAERL